MKLSCLVMALALVACGSKKDGDGGDDSKVASCHMAEVQSCREYRGDNLALGTDSIAKLCNVVVSSAKFSETPCPTDKVIGTCKKPEGKDFYYEGGSEAADALEKSCKESGGTFAKK